MSLSLAKHIPTTPLALLLSAQLLGAMPSAHAQAQAEAGAQAAKQEPVKQEETPQLFSKLKFEKAAELAVESKKLMLMVWSVEGDADGERLLKRTLSDPELIAWMKEIAVCLHHDPKARANLAAKHAIVAHPCITILDPVEQLEIDRIERFAHVGNFEPARLRRSIEGLLVGRTTVPERPAKELAKSPQAWLAWGNHRFSLGDEGVSDALNAYLWCLDHADETDPAFLDENFEFLVYRLRELGTRTSQARPALGARRDTVEGVLMSGEGNDRLANFFARYNFWLREEGRSIAFVEATKGLEGAIVSQRQIVFRQCFARAVAERRYDLVIEAAGDMTGEITARMAAYEAERARLTEAGRTDELTDLVKDVRAKIVNDGIEFAEALLGAGRGADALELIDALTKSAPNARIYANLVLRCHRLGLDEMAADIGQRGITAQGENERAKRVIDRALARRGKVGAKETADDGHEGHDHDGHEGHDHEGGDGRE